MKRLLLILFTLTFYGGTMLGQTLPDNWTGDSDIDTYQESTIVHGGSYSCKINVNTGSQASCDFNNSTSITVTAGNSYTVKFWYQTSAHVKGRLHLLWTGASAKYETYTNANASTWTEFSYSRTVPAGATALSISIRFYDQSGFSAPETQYIDDLTFESPLGTSLTVTNGDLESWPSIGGPIDPSAFSATTASSTQIDLSWTQNTSSNNVMIAWSSDGTFGTPSDGTTYAAGDAITGGGTVLYNGSAISYNHTSLTSGTHYYYKAWSADGSNNYSGGVTADATTIPDLMITEVMQNPHDVSDANGEWFEIYNYGSSTVDINGYVIKDAGTESHTINNGGALNIVAGSFLVLGKNSDVNTNGGVPVDYQYSGITLGNGADGIILCMSDGITEVDKIAWDGGPIWPDPTGASMVFTGQPTNNNNNGSNWTTATDRENNYANPAGTETDKGSPGTNGHGQDLVSSTTWTGTGNWGGGNKVGHNSWNHGSPGSNVSVIIDGDVTIDKNASDPAVCNDLTINSGKRLTVSTGKALTVKGNFTNSATAAGLVIQSDVTGNGSLIVNGAVSGNVTVERYVGKYTSGTGTGNGWHEIGCPVASMDPNGTNWDPDGTNNDLYAWNESDNQWVNYRTTPFTFSAGTGYLVANNTDLTHGFTGTLNTSDVTVGGLTSTSGEGEGWNLLGNPFPCTIKWNDGNWTLTNVGAVAEIWDETNATYAAINANDIIPSTNGFFVQVAVGTTGSVTIPAAARTHDAMNNYKSASATNPKETFTFKITNDANTYSDKSILGLHPDATEDWDIAYDAHKLLSFVKTVPQIWTVSNGQKYLVNYLPETSTAYDVPLDFRAGVNTVYHLTIKGADSFENTSLVLEDLQTGQKIDLSNENSYDFSATKEDDVNRFVLHINGVTAVPTLNETDGIQVFAYGKTVCLHVSGQKSLNGKVSVFNTLGQEIYTGSLNGMKSQKISLNQKTGIYFVRVEENNSVVTRKVFIK